MLSTKVYIASYFWYIFAYVSRSAIFRPLKNAGVLTVANIVNKAANLATAITIGRLLGVDAFSNYSLGLAWTSVIFAVSKFGLDIYIRREVVVYPHLSSRIFNNALSFRIISVLLALGGLVTLILVVDYDTEVKSTIFLLGITYGLDAINQLFYSMFEAYERMKFEGIITLIYSVLMILFVLLWLWSGGQLSGALLLLILASLFKLGLSYWILTTRFLPVSLGKDMGFWRTMLVESYPIALATIFVMINFRADAIMLSVFSDKSSVGIYNAAYSLLSGTSVISSAYLTSVFSSIAKATTDKQNLKHLFNSSLKVMSVFGLSLAVIITLFSSVIIRIGFGNSYVGKSDNALIILAWSVFFMFLSSTCGVFLNATNNRKWAMYFMGFIAVFNVSLNYVLIPKWSYIGASIVTVASYAIGFILMFIYIRYNILISKSFIGIE